ncbi:hypothetical protein ACOMHN_025806 [Nucella lapillus]
MMISVFLVALVAAMAVGCRKETVLTYNTGLVPLVHGYKNRSSAVVDAIALQSAQTDVMCLQELWFEDDMKSVLDKVGKDFPHHYSAIHSSVGNLRATNGLMILSRRPLTDVQYVDFHDGKPVMIERGYIKATTDGGMNYVCTHLTTNSAFYFEGSCTFCGSENPVLIAEGAWKSDIDIDHVLTSPGVTADVNSSQRVLDDVSLMLSDHFGVQQDICLP